MSTSGYPASSASPIRFYDAEIHPIPRATGPA